MITNVSINYGGSLGGPVNVERLVSFTRVSSESLECAGYGTAELPGFDCQSEIPNDLTRETLEKLERGEDLHSVDTIDELFVELESDD